MLQRSIDLSPWCSIVKNRVDNGLHDKVFTGQGIPSALTMPIGQVFKFQLSVLGHAQGVDENRALSSPPRKLAASENAF
jgi:hypothetical protein